jgi:hypothetical protein
MAARAATEFPSIERRPGCNGRDGADQRCSEVGAMAWRKTGRYRPAEEIQVMTCDVCERDVGFEDGRRPNEHFRLSLHPKAGTLDDQEAHVIICSRECLRAFAANVTGPDRTCAPKNSGSS